MKSTQATVQRRVEEVLELRLAGAALHNIRQYANAPDPQSGRAPWDVSDSTLWRYIRQADALLAAEMEKDREKLFNRHIAQRRLLLGRCLAQNDLAAAGRVLADEARLLGLYDTPPPALPAAALDKIDTPADVTRLVAATIAELKGGKLDRATASVVGTLAAGLLKSMELSELDGRLKALEAAAQQGRRP